MLESRRLVHLLIYHLLSNPSIGTVILVAHHPPALTYHSIEDGRILRSLQVFVPDLRLTRVWWTIDEITRPTEDTEADPQESIPDIINREGFVVCHDTMLVTVILPFY